MRRRFDLDCNIVMAACAISAGTHLGLVPDHWREARSLGLAFVIAALLLAVAAVLIARGPRRVWPPRLAALLLGGLMLAYAASRTTGLPLLHAGPETLDPVGLTTKLIEATGLVSALRLAHSASSRRLLAPNKGQP